MAEVIRDAIIRLKLETQRGKLESPEVEKISRAYREQNESSRENTKRVEENRRAVRESIGTHQAFGVESAKAFKHGLEGAMQFGRGFALMASSTEEDTRKMLEMFVKIEAATALIRGAMNLGKFAAALHPVTRAVAAVAAAVGTAAFAWRNYQRDAEESLKAVGDSATKESKRLSELLATQQKIAASMADMRAAAGLSESEQQNRRERERQRLINESGDLIRRTSGDTGLRDVFARGLQSATRGDLSEESRQRAEASLLWDAKRLPNQAREQLTLETQLRDSMRRRIEFEKEYNQQQADAIQAQTAAYGMGLGIVATTPMGYGATPALLAAGEGVERRSQQAIGKLQDNLDTIVTAFERAAERVRVMGEVIKQLDQGAAK